MKRIGIALLSALVAVLLLSGITLADGPWDVEDPCVADNEDFVYGGGNGMEEFHFGGQWLYGGGDGHNLYRDDTTDTGNLDSVWIHTETPDAIDLPSGLYYMEDERPDTWYWATEARGYNLPPPAPSPSIGGAYDGFAGQFLVIMCGHGSHSGYNWVEGPKGKTLAKPVSQICHYCFNGFRAYYKLEMPEGTVVEGYYNSQRVQHLEFNIIEGEYHFSPANIKFSQPVSLYQGIDGKWVKVLEFTQVLSGKTS
ncbi:hypothetical protein ES703_30477 [subsurface metagenome]